MGGIVPMSTSAAPKIFTSIQPTDYQSKTNFVNAIILDCFYGLLSITILFALLIIFSERSRQVIIKLDLYPKKYENDSEDSSNNDKLEGWSKIKTNQKQQKKKTSIGAIFSLFFISGAFLLILSVFLSYGIDNIQETKTLVPSILSSYNITSPNVKVFVWFYIYGGVCVDENNNCLASIYIQESGISYFSKKTACQLNYVSGQKVCQVEIDYTNLYVPFAGSINIENYEYSGYAGLITVNITSVSSIPGETSSISYSLYPTDASSVFKGVNPSIFPILITPSVLFI